MSKKLPKFSWKWVLVHLPEIIAGAAVTFSITLTTINAITRYALSYTVNGSDEYNCIAFGWLTFLGAAAAFRRKMHYGIDLVVNAFPAKLRTIAELVAKILIAVIMCTLTYLSVILCMNVRGKIFTATGISYLALDAAVLLGFGLMALYSLWQLFETIRDLPKAFSSSKEVAK